MEPTKSLFDIDQKLRLLIEDCIVNITICDKCYSTLRNRWEYFICGKTNCDTVNEHVSEEYLINNTF